MKSPRPRSLDGLSLSFSDWSSLRYHLYHAYEGPVWPAARVGTYRQQEADVSCWLLQKGSLKLTAGGKSLTARIGQWAFVTSTERHQAFTEDAQILSLRFYFSWPGHVPVVKPSHNLVFDAKNAPQLERTARPLIRHVRRRFPEAAAFLPQEACSINDYLRVQNLLPMWLTSYLQALENLGIFPHQARHLDDRVLEGIMELDRHPLHQRFSEKSLLTQIGLGRSQYDALFVSAMGVTPRRYLELRRLESAKNLLTHTETPIKEISFHLGFRHASYFSLWFVKHQGTSATEYRAKHTAS